MFVAFSIWQFLLHLVFFFVFMAILTAFNFSFSFINKLNSRFIELSEVKSFGPLATASIMGSVSAFIATPCVTPLSVLLIS